jgi:hypothetical protein
MILAVADEDAPGTIDEDPVRAREAATERGAVGSVVRGAVADDGSDPTGPVDPRLHDAPNADSE